MHNGNVVILVEAVDHGQALLDLLPGWRLDHALPADDAGQRGTAATGPARQAGFIVTAVRAARDGIDAGILIRAGAGRWPFTVPGFPPASDTHPHGVLLVDFDDALDAETVHDSRRRRHDYGRRGWRVIHDGEKE